MKKSFGMNTMHKVISKVDKLTGATLVAIHNGREAGQEIPHVHIHLVPRSANDSGGPIHCLFDSTLNVSDSETNEIYLVEWLIWLQIL